MMDLPDAPWIREAELYGVPEAEDVYCPVCGEENPEYFYTDGTGIDVVGCSCCIKRYDPWKWTAEHRG